MHWQRESEFFDLLTISARILDLLGYVKLIQRIKCEKNLKAAIIIDRHYKHALLTLFGA